MSELRFGVLVRRVHMALSACMRMVPFTLHRFFFHKTAMTLYITLARIRSV